MRTGTFALLLWNLSDYHTDLHLNGILKNIIGTYEIDHKTLGITLDKAADNNIIIEELDSNGNSFQIFHHICCFAHVLDLGAKAALNVVDKDLEILRNLIKKIKKSSLSEEKFETFQTGTKLKPILDFATWTSYARASFSS